MLAAIRGDREVFAAILDPAHREATLHGQPRQTHFLGQQDALVSEATADVGRDDPDLSLIHLKAIGQAVAHDVRHLACSVQHELVQAMIQHRHHAAPFDRRHALPAG